MAARQKPALNEKRLNLITATIVFVTGILFGTTRIFARHLEET
jgi:hypothetical protein